MGHANLAFLSGTTPKVGKAGYSFVVDFNEDTKKGKKAKKPAKLGKKASDAGTSVAQDPVRTLLLMIRYCFVNFIGSEPRHAKPVICYSKNKSNSKGENQGS